MSLALLLPHVILFDAADALWPKLHAVRGWAFAYNFSNTTLYPPSTVNLYATLNPQNEKWDVKHGIHGYSALEQAERMAERGILPLVWSYCWQSPYPRPVNGTVNKTAAVEYFADFTFPYPWVAGAGLDECLHGNVSGVQSYEGERELAAKGFRLAKSRNPDKFLAAWGSMAGDELFASLMQDGTFDLAMVEGYTYCAEKSGSWPCARKGTPYVEQYFERLDFARARGYLNRTVFSFGFMLGASAANPNAWTPEILRTAMHKVKSRYPEMPGVIMFGRGPDQGFANASNCSTPATEAATLEIIRAAGQLMLELYPDPHTTGMGGTLAG